MAGLPEEADEGKGAHRAGHRPTMASLPFTVVPLDPIWRHPPTARPVGSVAPEHGVGVIVVQRADRELVLDRSGEIAMFSPMVGKPMAGEFRRLVELSFSARCAARAVSALLDRSASGSCPCTSRTEATMAWIWDLNGRSDHHETGGARTASASRCSRW